MIGGWTTASLRQARCSSGSPTAGHQTTDKRRRRLAQVSRLGMPLVNEVVIGLKDKDKFNASQAEGRRPVRRLRDQPDAAGAARVCCPAMPAALAPTNFPRTDLVTAFLTGIAGVNKPANVTPSEMLRLNTAIRAGATRSRTGWASPAA